MIVIQEVFRDTFIENVCLLIAVRKLSDSVQKINRLDIIRIFIDSLQITSHLIAASVFNPFAQVDSLLITL